jgi:hypothetical protein
MKATMVLDHPAFSPNLIRLVLVKYTGFDPRNDTVESFTISSLHNLIMPLVNYHEGLGCSSSCSSIYFASLAAPVLHNPQCLEYRIEDGRFHDGRNYYVSVEDGATIARPGCNVGVAMPRHRIISSSLGVNLACSSRLVRMIGMVCY